MRFVFHPGEMPLSSQLGGKARALALLHGKGLSIPEWFVVLPSAFEASLPAEKRRAFFQGNDRTRAQVLSELTLAPDVVHELHEAFATLCPTGERVAVRSSAIDEDGRVHSYAGQLNSFLLVPPQELVAKIVLVWQSAFSPRVRAYRERHQITGPPQPPAVIVQRMVQAEAAGVGFGLDPIAGRQDVAVVSAVCGLGTSLVNGDQDADTWYVDARGRIVRRRLAPTARAEATGQGTNLPGKGKPKNSRRPVLDDAQVPCVARLVRRAGEILGVPQDIEWAFEKGRLYLLQSRPITSNASEDKVIIWDNSNIIESYSEVTLPLTFSFAKRAYTGVYRQFCQLLGVPTSRIAAHEQTFQQMLGLIRGRVYYNLLNWYRVLSLLPGFTLNRRFMEQMMGVKEELPEEVLAELGTVGAGERVKDAIDLAGSLGALVANHFLLPRKIHRFRKRLDEALAPPVRELDLMSAGELTAYFLDLERKLLTRWDAPLLNDFFAMIFYGLTRRLLGKWADDLEGTLQNDLLCGEGGMISTEPAALIREMAELAATSRAFVVELCEGSLTAITAAFDCVPEFRPAYAGYLAKFGDRCLGELKLESLTLHDDPLPLLRSVGQLARLRFSEPPADEASARGVAESAPPASFGGVPSPNQEENRTGRPASSQAGPIGLRFVDRRPDKQDTRRKAEARISRALATHPLRRVLFRWILRHTRARVRDRENLRFERTRLFARVRRIFLALGHHLQAAGHLNDSREVFLLEVDEILGFVAGASSTSDLKPLVALRQTEFSNYEATPPPPNRFTTRGIGRSCTVPEMFSPISTVAEGQRRKGIGCCPGIVRGRVRKIANPHHAVIQQDEILVAERTDPGWILLFPAAAGLLVERGSLLSHSAIVARELRLPAIVSIEGLMSWLNDGDEVEFDGSTGVVQRIEKTNTTAGGIGASILPSPAKNLSINTSGEKAAMFAT